MKKRFLLLTLFTSLLFFACSSKTPSPVPNNPISLSETSISISEDRTYQLSATVDQSISKYLVFWSMRDTSVAKVDTNGLVTAIKEGSTICQVQCSKYIARCAINVTAYEPDAALSVEMAVTNITISIDDVYELPLIVKLGEEIINNYRIHAYFDNEMIATLANKTIVPVSRGNTIVLLTISYQKQEAQIMFNLTIV